MEAGTVVFHGLEYQVSVEAGGQALQLQTFDPEAKLKVAVTVAEGPDTATRLERFWGTFARVAADHYAHRAHDCQSASVRAAGWVSIWPGRDSDGKKGS